MIPRKNVFGYFVVSLFVISMIYTLAGGVVSPIVGDREYPYLRGGIFLLLILVGWLLLNGGAGLVARIDSERRLRSAAWMKYVEIATVAIILAVAAVLRICVVEMLPMEIEGDYRTGFDIAELIAKGSLQGDEAYRTYIALFPSVYGYAYVLSLLFRVFGVSVTAAQYLNVVLSVITVFIAYRTARLVGGRFCAVVALLIAALWPSQIIYINILDSGYLFSFMLMLAVYVFVKTMKNYSSGTKRPVLGVFLHIFLGIWLALASAVRPVAVVLLIAIVICYAFERMRLPVRATKDQPISLIFLSKGWMRCVAVVLIYAGVSLLISIGITNTIDMDLASGSASYGYDLLVGLNTVSEGGWNQEDNDYLYEVLNKTGSAREAQLACLDLATQRLSNVRGITDLFFNKFHQLWMNDEYGVARNLFFMEEQGTLTGARMNFLYLIRDWGNIFYLFIVGLAAIEGIFLWRKGAGLAYPFILVHLGTVIMYLLLETQNSYHFHSLYMLAILASLGVKEICDASRVRVQQRLEERRREAQYKKEDEEKKAALKREEEHLTELRQTAMQSRFDMKDALEKGFIKVRVTKAYADEKDVEINSDNTVQ